MVCVSFWVEHGSWTWGTTGADAERARAKLPSQEMKLDEL